MEIVSFGDVPAHMLLLIRMVAEHSLPYALQYERELQYELQSLTRSFYSNFGCLICCVARSEESPISWTSNTPGLAERSTVPGSELRKPKFEKPRDTKDSAVQGRQSVCFNVILSNQVWIPQAQHAVYRNFSTEFHVCHEEHVQTQFG